MAASAPGPKSLLWPSNLQNCATAQSLEGDGSAALLTNQRRALDLDTPRARCRNFSPGELVVPQSARLPRSHASSSFEPTMPQPSCHRRIACDVSSVPLSETIIRGRPRCAARTRSGNPCQSPATAKGRCRMHGGSGGGGTPVGPRIGQWKHGLHSNAHLAMMKAARVVAKGTKSMVRKMGD